MSDIGRVAAIGVLSALCALVVRKQTPAISTVLALVAGGIILLSSLPALTAILGFMDELAEAGGLSAAAVAPMVKVAGISIITHMAAQVCKDANEGGLAGFVETAGTVMALVTAIPLMSAVLSTLGGLL